MYKILTVDDEYMITDNIFEALSDEYENECQIFKAYSANEALEVLKHNRIDIVITDISMPELDGIGLMKIIKENWPKCRVVFLTGYDKFEYAYEALKNKDVYYVLKADGIDTVIDTVRTVIDEIEIDKAKSEEAAKVKLKMEDILSSGKMKYLILLAQGGILNTDRIDNDFKTFEIQIDTNRPLFLLLGRIDSIDVLSGNQLKPHLLSNLIAISESVFNEYFNSVYFSDEKNTHAWILQPKDLVFGEMTSIYIRECAEELQETIKSSEDYTISLVFSTKQAGIKELPLKFTKLKEMLDYAVSKAAEVLLPEENNMMELLEDDLLKSTDEYRIYTSKVTLLSTMIENDEQDKFFLLFDEIIKPLTAQSGRNNPGVIEFYYTIAVMLLSHINKYRVVGKIAFKIGINQLMRLEHFESYSEAVEYLREIAIYIFQIKKSDRGNYIEKIIESTKKYINENYNKDISLTLLANHVYFNPSYLSRVFKEQTGENLTEYINRVRIDWAKKFLKDPNNRIQDVSEMCGYVNRTSFARFFRKYTGLSPQQFRVNEIDN